MAVQALVYQAFQCFSYEHKDDVFKDRLNHLVSLMDSLTSSDLNFDPLKVEINISKPCINYIPVCKNDTFSLQVFAIEPGGRIPLHNHPGMYGLVKVIYGSVHLTSFSDAELDKNFANLEAEESQVKPVFLYEDRVVSCDDDCCVVTPQKGNYHEIVAQNGVAVIVDLLSPPYNKSECGKCCYYQVLREFSSGKFNQIQGLRWLKEVPVPQDYCGRKLTYTGPPLS